MPPPQLPRLKVDTKAEVAKVVPLDYKGQSSYWYVGPNQASPQIEVDNDAKLWDAWKQTYPGIPTTMGENVQNLDYNQMLDKLRTAAAGNAAPDVARLPILWGAEVRHLERQVLRHPDQQRNDGLHLEQGHF